MSPNPTRCLFNVLLLCALPSLTHAAASVQSGDWADPATWGGAVPGSTEYAAIRAGHTVTVTTQPPKADVNIATGGTLVIADTGQLLVCGGCGFSNTGTVEVSGTLTLGEALSTVTYSSYSPFTIHAGGTLVVAQYSIFRTSGSTFTNNGLITNNGQFINALNGNSMLINHGTIDDNGILFNEVEMHNTGTITINRVDLTQGLLSSSYRFYGDGGTIITYPGGIWTSTEIFTLSNGAVFNNYGSFRPTGGIHHIESGSAFNNYNQIAASSIVMALDGGAIYTYCGSTQNSLYGNVIDICADTLLKNGFDEAATSR
jgi:hypothetical protein